MGSKRAQACSTRGLSLYLIGDRSNHPGTEEEEEDNATA